MSHDTPQTNEAEKYAWNGPFAGEPETQAWNLARELERERNAARDENIKLRIEIAKVRDQLCRDRDNEFEIARTNHEVTLADLMREHREAGDLRLKVAQLETTIARLREHILDPHAGLKDPKALISAPVGE